MTLDGGWLAGTFVGGVAGASLVIVVKILIERRQFRRARRAAEDLANLEANRRIIRLDQERRRRKTS